MKELLPDIERWRDLRASCTCALAIFFLLSKRSERSDAAGLARLALARPHSGRLSKHNDASESSTALCPRALARTRHRRRMAGAARPPQVTDPRMAAHRRPL